MMARVWAAAIGSESVHYYYTKVTAEHQIRLSGLVKMSVIRGTLGNVILGEVPCPKPWSLLFLSDHSTMR